MLAVGTNLSTLTSSKNQKAKASPAIPSRGNGSALRWFVSRSWVYGNLSPRDLSKVAEKWINNYESRMRELSAFVRMVSRLHSQIAPTAVSIALRCQQILSGGAWPRGKLRTRAVTSDKRKNVDLIEVNRNLSVNPLEPTRVLSPVFRPGTCSAIAPTAFWPAHWR